LSALFVVDGHLPMDNTFVARFGDNGRVSTDFDPISPAHGLADAC
jgi:hypothetical protein